MPLTELLRYDTVPGKLWRCLDSFNCIAEVMNREHEAAAAAASQLTEQLSVQQLAAKQALKQVSCTGTERFTFTSCYRAVHS